jgi:uncharacterized OB-fold protein
VGVAYGFRCQDCETKGWPHFSACPECGAPTTEFILDSEVIDAATWQELRAEVAKGDWVRVVPERG